MDPEILIVTKILSIFTLLADLAILFLAVLIISRAPILEKVRAYIADKALPLGFLVAAGSTLASIFYSNIAGFTPCTLCWWQRVFLYPLVIIFGLALWKKKTDVGLYAMALSGMGGLIAVYHSYLQFGGSPLVPCDAASVSCSLRYFNEFGYVNIPTMALTAFLLVFLLFVVEKATRRRLGLRE